MYEEGKLLRFSPFEFKNGNTPKPKYYIVLKHIDDDVMMASLPTSKDHIPADAMVSFPLPSYILHNRVKYERDF